MHRLLLFAVALLLPAYVAAQDWVFDSAFPPDPDRQFSSGHGVAVDPDGKIWVQYFSATDSVQVPEFTGSDPAGRDGYRDVRVIYVFNADGTEASISPVKFIDLPGGARDTLGGFLIRDANGDLAWEGKSNRGLRADPTGASLGGDILVSSFDFLYRLDYQTGEGKAVTRFDDYCALTQPASDVNGSVYVSPVCPGPPIRELSGADLSFSSNVTDASSNFSRSLAASADGTIVWEMAYENTYTIIHQRPDVFSPFDSVGVTGRGMRTESGTYQPNTGWLWLSSGNVLNLPNQDPTVETNWDVSTWYAFDVADLLANEVPTALDSIKWFMPNLEARPRGLAFTADGQTAYVDAFSELAPSFQKFTRTGVSNEPGAIANVATLEQNQPNPASGATEIRFTLEEPGHARVRLYDVAGRELMTVLDETLAAGEYGRQVSVNDLPAGTYVYTLEVGGQVTSRRMLVVR
jgi:hypothetical protein